MANITSSSYQRRGEIVRGVFKVLLNEPEGLHIKDILSKLEKEVPPTPHEREPYKNNPNVLRYHKNVNFHTVNSVAAGWLTKGHGHWSLTEAGKKVYADFTDPEDFFRESAKKYYEARGSQQPKENDAVDESDSDGTESSLVTLEIAEGDVWKEVKGYLSQMSPYAFQEAVAGLLEGMGHHIECIASPGRDGGIDIHAATDNVAGRRIKVQVKRRQGAIPVAEMRSFRGTLKTGDIGIFVSTGHFTEDAVKEARASEQHLILINGKDFFDLWVSHYERIPEGRRRLLPIKRVAFLNPQ